MDQNSAPQDHDEQQATPIFSAYRRGYDPEQVDRYVADQQRRLDQATTRASESERRLAAAVGQLRELHRRVAVLESEDHTPQPPALDTLGERVQRILQEAWEGAYALRQSAENDANELRTQATAEADEIVGSARHKAQALDEATERRRQAFLERMEEDRNRAVAQIAYLHDQRRLALEELLKVKVVIEDTVAGARFPAGERPVLDGPAGAGEGPQALVAGAEDDDDVMSELLAELTSDAFLDEVAAAEAPPVAGQQVRPTGHGEPLAPGFDERAVGPDGGAKAAAGPTRAERGAAAGDAAVADPGGEAGMEGGGEAGGAGGNEAGGEAGNEPGNEPGGAARGEAWRTGDLSGDEPGDDLRPTLPVQHLGSEDARPRRPSPRVFDFEAEEP